MSIFAGGLGEEGTCWQKLFFSGKVMARSLIPPWKNFPFPVCLYYQYCTLKCACPDKVHHRHHSIVRYSIQHKAWKNYHLKLNMQRMIRIIWPQCWKPRCERKTNDSTVASSPAVAVKEILGQWNRNAMMP